MAIDPDTIDPDPFRQFELWLADAITAGIPSPDAFALATSSADGAPSARVVLLRGHGPDGFAFYTNRGSRKGRDLEANPRAAAVFHWPLLQRQLRVSGSIERLSDSASEAYFAGRPRGHRLSAWASEQGQPIASRSELLQRVADLEVRFPTDQIPLPPDWGGYRLRPDRFEFWVSRADRLHDRVEYERVPDGWTRRRLQP